MCDRKLWHALMLFAALLASCQPAEPVAVRAPCAQGADAALDGAPVGDHGPARDAAPDTYDAADTDAADGALTDAEILADLISADVDAPAVNAPDGSAELCATGQARCADLRTQQRCVSREGQTGWETERSCAPTEACEPRWGFCARRDARCPLPALGSLACGPDQEVYRCVNHDGEFLLVPQLNCVAEGFSTCIATPARSGAPTPAADACFNACGGRNCRLSAIPGTMGTLWCSHRVCHSQPTAPADRCRLVEDRDDCRGPGAPCDLSGDSRQCASGHCGSDRLCD